MKLRANELSWREIDGEMVVLDLRTSTYLSVNRVGTLLLRLLTDDRSIGDLTDAVVAEFEVDRSTAETDVRAFVDDLRSRELLEPAY